MRKREIPARTVAFCGLLLAAALVLSALEAALPAIPSLPPGIKPGFANVVVMYALIEVGAPWAAAISVLKSGFVLISRGITAGWVSLCGGLLSLCGMALLTRARFSRRKNEASLLLVSVTGAVLHNIGQLAAAAVMTGTPATFTYLPVLLAGGVLTGLLTGTVLRYIWPILAKIQRGAAIDGKTDKGD